MNRRKSIHDPREGKIFADPEEANKLIIAALSRNHNPNTSDPRENLHSLNNLLRMNKIEMEGFFSQVMPFISINNNEYKTIKGTIDELIIANNKAIGIDIKDIFEARK